MISYAPFWKTLKDKNLTIYSLITKHGINSNTINCIKKQKGITTYTIDKLCQALDCNVSDIMVYYPNPTITDSDAKK